MTKEELIATAQRIEQPPLNAAQEYAEKREMLASEMNRIMGARPDLELLIGKGNRSMMEDNHRNHARFLESLFFAYNPEVLVETVLWVFRAYRSHGFQLTYWPAQLDTWVEISKRELQAEAYSAIYPFYHWMIIHQPAFVSLSDRMITGSTAPSNEVPGT
ncbi:MAG: hypothetical protein WCQ90_04185 [Deltaproteobacteria bacterium]